MIKTLKFDFFHVIMPNDSTNAFETVIYNIEKLVGTKRVYDNGDYPVRLQRVKAFENFIVADIARIRMNDIPDKMKLSGETETIALDEDQGLGEITSFLYHPTLGILILMRNRNAVSISAISNYIESKGKLYGVKYESILHEDAYKRLAGLDVISKLDLEVAAPGNGTIFKDLGLTSDAIIELMGATPRARITCTLSMGHTKDSLPKKILMGFVKKILNRKNDETEAVKLVVSGREGTLEKEIIDLFEDVLTDQMNVDIKAQRKITDDQRHNAIVKIWIKHQASLQKTMDEIE